MQTAKDELARSKEFDHIVVNDELETAVADLVELLGL
ncbi:MAG: hypothetical protein CR979_01325 [Propionibacterium sp.]|nr:MAG: hypothetical protein CR979_01325 [Propionibacterium sp.]